MITTGLLGKRAAAEKAATPVAPRTDALSQPSTIRATTRQRLLMDHNWRFALGHACDPEKDFGFGKLAGDGAFAHAGNVGGPVGIDQKKPFDDHSWELVNLPHDWAVGLPFVLDDTLTSHGGKPLGREFPATSVGWYRKTFDIPKDDLGKRISIEFDGVFRDAMVFVNGHYIGSNWSGYVPMAIDASDFLNYGSSNLVTVRVDATYGEGWFYEGAGIYRHVWLTKTSPLHIVRWGNFVQSEVKGNAALLKISSEVINETTQTTECRIHATVLDADGKKVAVISSPVQSLEAGETRKFSMEAKLASAKLWSIENPTLYKLVTVVETNGQEVDQDETTFGIRSIRFDVDKGFFLNDKPVKIKGTCNHQDHAGVGVALPDRLQSYRVEILQQMGSNAYRTSHNAPTPELLDACDRLGMLVMDENRTFSSSPEGLSELERMVRRDRNHPSVILWSLGNEEPQQGTERGARICASMKRLVRSLDPTRLVTMAMNGSWGKGISSVVDVQGFNYFQESIDAFRAKFPRQPLIGTEVASTISTRGIYAKDAAKGYVSAYDTNEPGWGKVAEDWWKFFDDRPWLSGGFVWTGFDYRGEPTPYKLPCMSSHFGIIDTCGFPKDNYFYYKTWWSSEPVLHLFPHWTWPGKEGHEVEVWCYCNQESVELFLNGKSLGRKTVEKNGHLVWKVPYVPGTLEARASFHGTVVLTAKRETAGATARILLTPDRTNIHGDGEDVSVVAVQLADVSNRPAPTADNKITFKLQGPGRLLGVGNGDPSCHEPDKPETTATAQRSAFNGLCMVIVQSTQQAGEITITARADGLESATATIRSEQATPRNTVD